jgi:hypothetical protein
MIQNRVAISPEAQPIRHKHPGEEIIYVLEVRWSTRSKASRRRRTAPAKP